MGKFFIPKIPSIRITDLAKAMAPDLELKFIGLRPGEKIHEIMCPADDSHLTIEFNDHFVIAPAIDFVDRTNSFTKNFLDEEGVLVPKGFEYNSGNNPVFLSLDEIKEMNEIAGYPMIPYGKQNLDAEDIQSVVDVLRSPLITQGKVVPAFERSIAERVGSKYSVAFISATSALHSACLALGLSKGDIGWTVPNSFVASANCILLTGAKVDFVDIDKRSNNISLEKLSEKLKTAKKRNKLPKVLIPVHFSGQPTIQEEIKKLSREYGFKILEDASHSIGASRNNEMVGSCKWSDITVFSFHPVKIITTGEGGWLLATSGNNPVFLSLDEIKEMNEIATIIW